MKTVTLQAGILATLLAIPMPVFGFTLTIDETVTVNTNDLPDRVELTLMDTAKGRTQLWFWCIVDDSKVMSWSLIFGDVSLWSKTHDMAYLKHREGNEAFFVQLSQSLNNAPIAVGNVEYKWKENESVVTRDYAVFKREDRTFSVVIDQGNDVGWDTDTAKKVFSCLKWHNKTP